jgi:hypothetical protein
MVRADELRPAQMAFAGMQMEDNNNQIKKGRERVVMMGWSGQNSHFFLLFLIFHQTHRQSNTNTLSFLPCPCFLDETPPPNVSRSRHLM